MIIKSIFVVACFLLPRVSFAVDISKDVLGIDTVEDNAALIDGKIIMLRGYIDGVNGIYFAYQNKASADVSDPRGIDIVEMPDKAFLSSVVESHGSCGVVTGKFVSFTGGVIGLGNFRSDIGYLVANSFRKISCKDIVNVGKRD